MGGNATSTSGAPAVGTGGGPTQPNGAGPIIDVMTSDASTDGGVIESDAACGTGSATAMQKQVNMFVMYDRSWSMWACGDSGETNSACESGPTRWDLTSEALKLFFQDPQAADLHVALRFFPDDRPAPGCTGYPTIGVGQPPFGMGGAPGMGGTTGAGATPNCDVDACAQPLVDLAPLTVEAAPLDAHEAALVAAVDAATPPGPEQPNPNPATPTSAALGGATQWAIAHQTANPDQQTVIVLITDGEPYGCDTNNTNIANLAATAYESGVLTYVIGLGGLNAAVLDQIAALGGTSQAITVASGDTSTQDLLDALLAIRGMKLSCEFAIPQQTSGGSTIDPRLINVNYSSGDPAAGATTTQFGMVADASACGTDLGWYFDDPTNPTAIILCPAACTTVSNDPEAHIELLAGCEPVIIPPR
jgi:hypothetical protein